VYLITEETAVYFNLRTLAAPECRNCLPRSLSCFWAGTVATVDGRLFSSETSPWMSFWID